MPKPCPLVLALAFLACGLPAQTQQVTCPPGNLTTEGAGYSLSLGLWANGRNQYVDGTCKGTKMLIRKMEFRLDNRTYITRTGLGRSWTQVTLSMCELDFTATPSATFSSNCTTTPVVVFRGSKSWPTVVGTPAKPAPWGGGGNGPFSFPFSSPWPYSGTRRMVYDFTFHGGSLSNSLNWGTGGMLYYMDADGYILDGGARCDNPIRSSPVPPNCNDSAITHLGPAMTDVVWCNYSQTSTVVAYRGKTMTYSRAGSIAPSATLVLAWGPPQPTPLNLGAVCNPLHVQPAAYFIAKTTVYGTFITPVMVFDQIPASYGFTLAAQTAWADSKTGRFSLTGAEITTLPGAPPNAINREKWSITATSNSAPVGIALIPGSQSFLAQTLPKLDYQ